MKSIELLCRLIFRGDRDDMAVICTDDKTFEVKEAETTNSLLLIPNCQLPEDLGRQTAEFGSNVTIKEVQKLFEFISTRLYAY